MHWGHAIQNKLLFQTAVTVLKDIHNLENISVF